MFRILESIELQGWRELPIDMPLSAQRYCPCDGTELRTAAAIVGDVILPPLRDSLADTTQSMESIIIERTRAKLHDNKAAVRVGCCPSCGYIGYQERPTESWFREFYTSDWDAGKD